MPVSSYHALSMYVLTPLRAPWAREHGNYSPQSSLLQRNQCMSQLVHFNLFPRSHESRTISRKSEISKRWGQRASKLG
ncbi:hypothetical protein N431DRAFT_431754 [Stipitochalara longipes BDJ]|nr:hypothetical protein N431DRAFT_431754 [Stipitochalara longipes BDJ]